MIELWAGDTDTRCVCAHKWVVSPKTERNAMCITHNCFMLLSLIHSPLPGASVGYQHGSQQRLFIRTFDLLAVLFGHIDMRFHDLWYAFVAGIQNIETNQLNAIVQQRNLAGDMIMQRLWRFSLDESCVEVSAEHRHLFKSEKEVQFLRCSVCKIWAWRQPRVRCRDSPARGCLPVVPSMPRTSELPSADAAIAQTDPDVTLGMDATIPSHESVCAIEALGTD
jgi:hypothetical protein